MTRRAVFRDDGTGALDDGTGTVPAAGTGFQPLDSDLTAIAALTTTSFGRALLELANAGALQAAADLEIGTDVQAYDADLAAIAALSPTNDDVLQRKAGAWTNRTMAQLIADLAALGTTFQPLDSDLTAIAALSTTAYGRALLTMADAAATKAALSLVKADVGLGNVDNTADSAKSVASAAILTTARTINGISFDGSANISLGWSAAFDIVNSNALTNLISQSIPGNTLGANGGLLVTVNGFYFNNSGASRGLNVLRVAFGGTNVWNDASGATQFVADADVYPFYMEFLLANEGATNAQRLSGTVSIGLPANAGTAGQGGFAGNTLQFTFHGSGTKDTTSAQTLLVSAQHTATSPSLQLKGTIHVQVVA